LAFISKVDMKTGKPCVDFLDNEEIWEPGTTIIGILQSLQVLYNIYIYKRILYIYIY